MRPSTRLQANCTETQRSKTLRKPGFAPGFFVPVCDEINLGGKMDQAALDLAYENGAFIPDGASYGPRWEAAAAAFRATTPCELDIPYGAHPRARYDVFFPRNGPRG